MRIQHNISAMNAYRNYTNNNSALSKNLEKLSSGYRINRAGDDAAGLAISEKMRAQIAGLDQAQSNAKSGVNLVQTAEGALTEVHDMLNRMTTLADQSANGTYDDETDRANLQKEVDQLKSEINRIADASNFNGLNLLDGTLGMNTNAFKTESIAASAGNPTGKIASSDMVFGNFHKETQAPANATTPTATFDLGNLTVDVDAATAGTLKFEIGGKTITADFTAGATGDTSDIATALAKGITDNYDVDVGGTGASNAFSFGNYAFKAEVSGNGVKLTLMGVKDSGGNWSTNIDDAAAAGINAMFGQAFSNPTAGGGVTIKGGDVVHKTTNVTYADAGAKDAFAGIDLELNDKIVSNGGKLTIDGTTYTFKTDANDTSIDSNDANTIDVSGETDPEKQLQKAADLLSQKTVTGTAGRTYKIGASGTTIHIEQSTKTTTTLGNMLSSENDLKKLISATGEKVAATNTGTKITVDDSKITDGDTITVDGKKYVFTDDASKAGTTDDESGTTYVSTANAGKNLATALGAIFDEDTNSMTIYADDKTPTKAPQVLGSGLTLQIGESNASFNKLNVAIEDMHTSSLGIGEIDISTQSGASDAIEKIKNAINTVSSVRGTLGASQNRLEHTMNNLSVMSENITDAESTIRDTDVASEMMKYTKNNILIQSAQAMLAQANQSPQGVLQLLQ